jgi:hypothetical protein
MGLERYDTRQGEYRATQGPGPARALALALALALAQVLVLVLAQRLLRRHARFVGVRDQLSSAKSSRSVFCAQPKPGEEPIFS